MMDNVTQWITERVNGCQRNEKADVKVKWKKETTPEEVRNKKKNDYTATKWINPHILEGKKVT